MVSVFLYDSVSRSLSSTMTSPPQWIVDMALGGLTLLAIGLAFVVSRIAKSPSPLSSKASKQSKTTEALLKSSNVASSLSLLVIKTTPKQLPRLREFYSMILNQPFIHEQHGAGPKHWSMTLPGALGNPFFSFLSILIAHHY
jgi:hypothetical protein